jgi:hypothetical protein
VITSGLAGSAFCPGVDVPAKMDATYVPDYLRPPQSTGLFLAYASLTEDQIR